MQALSIGECVEAFLEGSLPLVKVDTHSLDLEICQIGEPWVVEKLIFNYLPLALDQGWWFTSLSCCSFLFMLRENALLNISCCMHNENMDSCSVVL